MKLTENLQHQLQFILDSSDTEEQRAFVKFMENYVITRHGSLINFHHVSTGVRTACMNSCDNSFFILQPEGYELAKQFGTKRFILGNARKQLTESQKGHEDITRFSRDRSFTLINPFPRQFMFPLTVLSFKELLCLYSGKEKQLYDELADLFHRCANFTPSKQAEYDKSALTDKLCRFNKENDAGIPYADPLHIFIYHKDKIIGTCSALIFKDVSGAIDVYIYDEVVDISDWMISYNQMDNTHKDFINDTAKSYHHILMGFLFESMREKVITALYELTGDNTAIYGNRINAFIRVAADRVEMYEKLGCSEANYNNFVIHGPRTQYAEMIDAHVKAIADKQLTRGQSFSPAAAIAAARYGNGTPTTTVELVAEAIITPKLN